MEAKKHPAYKEEEKHLVEVKEWVKKEKENLKGYEDSLKEEIKAIRKTVSHLQDERLLAKQLLHHYAERNLKNFIKAEEAPYFGRVDFQERYREDVEVIYIGKFGLHDENNDVPVVVDWRAPIADIYYSGHSKEVSYRGPGGEIEGSMHLKRRYEIANGALNGIYDEKTSEAIIEDSLKGKGDFLIDALKKTSSGRLKEIVATIQDQQNKIIRSDSLQPLVVQGVAGSGKTTIALHRMAYLIYTNRKNINTANYMVIAPNRLFLDYISDILPELGVDNVKQTTFEDWTMELLGREVKVLREKDKLDLIINSSKQQGRIIEMASKMKASILFKRVIDNHLKKLELSLMPRENISKDGVLLISYEKINEVFRTSNLHLSLDERVKKMKIYLKNKLKGDSSIIKERVEDYYQNKLIKARALGGKQQDIIRIYDERDRLMDNIIKDIPQMVDDYVKKVQGYKPKEFYKYIIDEKCEMEKAFGNKLGNIQFDEVWHYIKEPLTKDFFEVEDLTPLAYLHIKLKGFNDKLKYNHIVVDEAQDFDEFRLSLLREIAINDSFTFVGDISQGIYGFRGTNSWERTMRRVFKEKSYHYHVLTTSYRSTIEIVQLANGIIKRCRGIEAVLAEPVFRHGEKPQLVSCRDDMDMSKKIADKITVLQKEGLTSIAIICKDLSAAERAYDFFKDSIDGIHILTEEENSYHSGVVVMPSYISKGLEFDGVILWKVDEESYSEDPTDVKLLYVGVTRALHKLYLYHVNKPTLILDGLL